jgi:amino acid adenylation domain-containing protein
MISQSIFYLFSIKSFITQFSKQVEKYSNSPALQYQQQQLSYQELDQLSHRLAAYLQSLSSSNSIMAILMPRCPEMIIGLLAILKCHSAYLPIATDLPAQRIQSILKQSQCSLILTLSSQKNEVNGLDTHYVFVDQILTSSSDSHRFESFEIDPHQNAYVIFTSGSTGQPKGVCVSHQALSLRLAWLQQQFLIQPQDRVAQNIAYHFDPSLIEIFLALTQGGTLVLLPESYLAHHGLAQFVIEEQIHTIALVPSSLQRLINELPANETTQLKAVCCGGDKLPSLLAQQFLSRTHSKLFNFYGPTEATIAATAWECQREMNKGALPLGKPADGTVILIVDAYLRPLPVGAEGEIVILGNTLAQGYCNDPYLTAQSFIDYAPLKTCLYRTGDTGYITSQGLLYFTGRKDRQVKISGYRIELDEIESVLLQNPDVVSVAVMVKNQNIYAYIQPALNLQNQSLIDSLSANLRETLPIYMQPKHIMAIDEMPLNSTGKVDYSTLLNLQQKTIKPQAIDSNPKSYLEFQLSEIWENILKIDEIAPHQNFFELGGDSLSALNLITAIETLSGQRLPLSFLLENPTIIEQAKALKSNQYQSEFRIMMPLSERHQDITVYLVASGYGDLLRFNDLAFELNARCNLVMLQPDDKNASIQSIAEQYAKTILNHSKSPFYMAGFSIGGVSALETTRLLCQHQCPPVALILLDTIYPRWPLQSPRLFALLKFLTSFFNLGKTKINNRKLKNMLNDPGIQVQHQALQNHEIKPAAIQTHLILTKGMWMFHPLLFSSWKRLFKHRLTIHSIKGMHGQIFQKPYINELVSCLQHIFECNPTLKK